MEHPKKSVHRCAIYTRKSSEEGLDQDFNSLHAQREACEAFIKSQQGEGWKLIKTAYDDGGLSGGTMERPAVQRLLADIKAHLVDVVVVYKVDRLTRSLVDFAKMVEVFDAAGVSFVAVTQQFNTTTSMGRLTLNVLLSFAQFEREVTSERIRDKIAASKKKGMWMGGVPPLGYDIADKRLVVNKPEAKSIKSIFRLYLELGCVRRLKAELDRRGILSKLRTSRSGTRSGGHRLSRGALYKLLSNPIYVGDVRHKEARHAGQHAAILNRKTWDKTQELLSQHSIRQGPTNRTESSVLIGKLFDEKGERLTPSHAVKNGARYRYYVSRTRIQSGSTTSDRGWRLPAQQIERGVLQVVCRMLEDHQAITAAVQEVELSASSIVAVLKAANAIKNSEARMTSMIDRVELSDSGISVSLDLASLLTEETRVENPPHLKMLRFEPLQMKRRGVELRLVIGGERSGAATPDSALLKAVARGTRWFNEISMGRVADTREIAKREGLSDRYVRRVLPLAFLAPAIVEQVCAGQQPADFTAEALTLRTDLPLDWKCQRIELKFE